MTWGEPVRLQGGHLTHYAGADRDGTRLLAHGDYAWTDTCLPSLPGARVCPRCARRRPELAAMLARFEAELRRTRRQAGPGAAQGAPQAPVRAQGGAGQPRTGLRAYRGLLRPPGGAT